MRAAAWRVWRPGLRLAPWGVLWLPVGPLAVVLVAGMMRVVDARQGLVS